MLAKVIWLGTQFLPTARRTDRRYSYTDINIYHAMPGDGGTIVCPGMQFIPTAYAYSKEDG